MFVSSYSTYINTNTADKTTKSKVDLPKDQPKSFSSVLSKSVVPNSNLTTNLPIDYVSNNKSFNIQYKMQEQTQSKGETKFKQISDMKSAKIAYSDNSVMFSLLKKPGISLDQTPKINHNLPQNIQDIKEGNLKHIMVNTYLENDKYYQVTA